MGGGGRAGLSLKSLRTFSSFKNRNFRLYYGAVMGQQACMNMQIVARALLIYRLTGSPAMLGVMSLANALPLIFFSLFGGVIADRVQKKRVLIVGQTGSAVVSLVIALALQLGYLSADVPGSWWILIVSSIFQGTILGLMMPSRQSLIPEIVSRDQLMNAVALNNLNMNTLRLLAPALAGFLIDAYGFTVIYYTMTGLYLIAVVFVMPMSLMSTVSLGKKGVLLSIKEGFQYVRRETTIFLLLGFTLFTIILSMPCFLLMPIFADDILKVGATGMGILFSVSGGGAIVGSVVLASMPNKKRGAMLLVSGLIVGLTLVVFSFSTSWYLSLAFIALVGVSQTLLLTTGYSLLLHYTAADYMGRVMSIFTMQWGFMGFGTLLGGLLAEAVGVQWTVGGFAMVLVLVFILALPLTPRIRKLD